MRLASLGFLAAAFLAVVSAVPIAEADGLDELYRRDLDILSTDAVPRDFAADWDALPRDFDDSSLLPRSSFGKIFDAAKKVEKVVAKAAKKPRVDPKVAEARKKAAMADTKGQAAKKAHYAAKKEQKKNNKAAEKAKTKVKFGPSARQGLNDLGLKGKDRKQAKNYYKNVAKGEMRKNSDLKDAKKAKIVHLNHEGGSVKGEKNHMNVNYMDGKGRTVTSKWTDKATGNTKEGGQHHVYPDKHNNVKPPKALTDAEAKRNAWKASPEGQKKLADDKKAKEDRASKKTAKKEAYETRKEERKKAAAESAGRAHGATLSAEDKKAQRAAAKAAKAAKRKGGSGGP